MPEITFNRPEKHPKGWGAEYWLANNDLYCGKLLEFNKGASFSMHYHLNKTETFYVLHGILEIEYFDLTNAYRKTIKLYQGDIVDIPAGAPHKLTAIEEAVIIEISTHHEDKDSYRIEKGDSQK